MNELADPLHTAVHALVAVIVAGDGYRLAAADHFGLDVVGSRAVSYLDRRGPMAQAELGKLLGLTSGGVTGVVDRLERLGVVTRVTDPRDRRRNRVGLTEQAAATLDGSRLGLVRAFEQLDATTVKTLAETLPLLAAGLDRVAASLRATAPAGTPGARSTAGS
jgi:DNA-binding MarR family transcriptional regulator